MIKNICYYSLSEVINKLKEEQVAKASFANEIWFIIKYDGFIRYFNEFGIGEAVPLTYSNINASYELL